MARDVEDLLQFSYFGFINLTYMYRIIFLFVSCLSAITSYSQTKLILDQPLKIDDQEIILGDPFMFKEENVYYLTGTGSDEYEGFPCFISTDMKNWKYAGPIWKKNEHSWASTAFWAPEVKKYNGKFYLTYSGFSERIKGLRIALAESDTPEGPYTDLHAPWFDYGFGAIDGHIFVDKDQPYLFFSMNGNRDGYSFGITYAVKLAKDLSKPIGDTVRVAEASQNWERVNWDKNRCNEGPFVFKYKDTYYMTYSANHTFEANYGIGYATAKSPLGPWIKASENPIADKNEQLEITGIGHNSILPTHKENEFFIIYHTHADPKNPENMQRYARIGLLRIEQNGKLTFSPTVN